METLDLTNPVVLENWLDEREAYHRVDEAAHEVQQSPTKDIEPEDRKKHLQAIARHIDLLNKYENEYGTFRDSSMFAEDYHESK